VLRWLDAFNRRDAPAAAACYHEDAINLQVAVGEPTVGRAALLQNFAQFFQAFPDNYTDVVNLLVDGEWVALEWTGGATWTGEFMGMPGNGRRFTLAGCGFFHVVDGKIKFQRGYWDKVAWFRALGIPLQ
jgi:steroid delta-isomerase-like uncharacterized protein